MFIVTESELSIESMLDDFITFFIAGEATHTFSICIARGFNLGPQSTNNRGTNIKNNC